MFSSLRNNLWIHSLLESPVIEGRRLFDAGNRALDAAVVGETKFED
jgi:hypothetical protein